VFSGRPGFEVASAGTDRTSANPVSSELVDWADVIFVMERAHRDRLRKSFLPQLKNKRIICLDIPDDFEYMDPKLIRILEAKAGPWFSRGSNVRDRRKQ
jgi:predicted protein tyrosine phosphatase